MILSATPSRASSTAWAWRSWCGAKRRRIPAWAASRRNSTRTLARDHGRPRVGPSMTQNSGPIGISTRAASHGRSCSSPRRPSRSRAADRPCRCARAVSRAWGRGRVRRARAPPGRAGRRARAPRSGRAACSRGGRRWPRASRRRSLRRSAGPRDRAAPCCGADVRRGSRAWSRASDADQRHRALLGRSWDLLPIAQRTEPAALPARVRRGATSASPRRCGSRRLAGQVPSARPRRASRI
jgi:hypothetical protein